MAKFGRTWPIGWRLEPAATVTGYGVQVHAVLSAIQSVPPLAAYLIIGALVFGEAAVFVGFVLPGETAVLLGGFLASTNHLNLAALCVLVVLAAIVGDSVGYEVGRVAGPRICRTRLFRRHEGRLEHAQRVVRERGGPAIFVGRFTAFLRAVTPGLAGLSGMHYRRFLVWNALGGLVWGTGCALLGYFAGRSYESVATRLGTGSAIVLAVLVVGLIVMWLVRRHRRGEAEEAAYDAAHSEPS